jgi:subtilisin family serine protease
MRRLALVAALGLAGAVLPATPSSAQEPKVAAVVLLRSQADVEHVRRSSVHEQRHEVERRLQATAASTQRDLVRLLRTRQKEGLADHVVPLWVTNAIGVRATRRVLAELASRSEVLAVRPDAQLTAPAPAAQAGTGSSSNVEPNVALTGAPTLWQDGFRGQGVVVASLDTGVDATHPDLAASWRGGTNSWFDPYGQHPSTPTDVSGHGTQTLGVVVGGQAGGSAIGMAPAAQWIAAKVFDDRGRATTTAIHQAFQWLLDPDHDPATDDAPDVVNASWSGTSGGCDLTFQPDLRSLRAAAVLPVFAAGNDGPASGTVFAPANLPEAVSVAGTDEADALDPSSSRGPSACAGATSPTVAAPGVSVRTSDLYGGYVDATGTSVAAPHVTGAVTLLLSALPGQSADRLEAALTGGAKDLGAPGVDPDTGYGRIDVAAAYQWLRGAPDFDVSAAPASASAPPGSSVSFGVTSSSINGFADPVTLGVTGLPDARSTWVAQPATLAGGSGTATVTVTSSSDTAPGSYPLTVTGTSGTTVRTAAVTLVVSAPPDFSVTATPTSAAVEAGSSVTFTVSVGSLAGFTGDVVLALSGLPASVGSATLAPATVHGSGTSTLAVSTLTSAAPGSYPLTVTGESGGRTHATSVTLVVTAPDFGLSAGPASVSVARGRTATYQVTVAAYGGFTSSVTLVVSGLPSGATASWTGNPVPGSGGATLSVRTSSKTPRGTRTLTINGSGGGHAHAVTVTLRVT